MPIVWVVLFVACAVCAHAQAISGYCGRPDTTALQWQYDAAERLLTITGNGQMLDFSLEEKAPWYPWHNAIEQVVLGDHVTSIGSYALYDLQQSNPEEDLSARHSEHLSRLLLTDRYRLYPSAVYLRKVAGVVDHKRNKGSDKSAAVP